MDTLIAIKQRSTGMWCLHHQEGCALGSPQHGLAEDLCPDRGRRPVKLHHALCVPYFPVHTKGKMTVARKTPTAGKPRKQPANWFTEGEVSKTKRWKDGPYYCAWLPMGRAGLHKKQGITDAQVKQRELGGCPPGTQLIPATSILGHTSLNPLLKSMGVVRVGMKMVRNKCGTNQFCLKQIPPSLSITCLWGFFCITFFVLTSNTSFSDNH